MRAAGVAAKCIRAWSGPKTGCGARGGGHGQRRRGGDVPLQFYSALLGSDGSVWPRAVGPASFAPCLRRYDVNNVHSSPKPDFLSTPQATSGPFPVLAVGRIGAWRAASRGQRAPRRSALVHGPVRGQAGGSRGRGQPRWAKGEERPAGGPAARAASPRCRCAVRPYALLKTNRGVKRVRLRRCAFLASLAQTGRKGWRRPA